MFRQYILFYQVAILAVTKEKKTTTKKKSDKLLKQMPKILYKECHGCFLFVH